MTMTTEMVHANGSGALAPVARTPAALAPASYDEMFRLAESMFRSKMFGVSSPEQAMVVLMTGLELGFSPAQAFRGIHVINNKPTLSADMMVAVCKSRPDVCHFFRMIETTDERATYETHRVGEPGPQRITFTAADAKRAGLLSNPTHQKYPGQMLRARAASGLARMVYSDLILGLYTEDEIKDIPAPPAPERPAPVNVTPNQTSRPNQTNPKPDVLPEHPRDTVIAMLAEMPLDQRIAWRERFEQKWGSPNPKVLSEINAEIARDAIRYKEWPFEDEFKAAMTAKAAGAEPDPFASDADQPELLAVAAAEPVLAGKGHGDS